MNPKLTNEQHEKMDSFLDAIFDGIKSGKIEKQEFIGKMAHVMSALDNGSTGEAVNWFEDKAERFILGGSKLSDGSTLS